MHGAAVVALLAGQLSPPEHTLTRLSVDFLTTVPMATLTLECSEPAGGRRVQRQEAVLSCDGRAVATARTVIVREGELDLPPKALDHPSPFDPAAAPSLVEPNRKAAETVGHDSFDSVSLIIEFQRVEGDRRRTPGSAWRVPVVEGTELRGTELAAVAADYGQSAVHRQLGVRRVVLPQRRADPPPVAGAGGAVDRPALRGGRGAGRRRVQHRRPLRRRRPRRPVLAALVVERR